jgi:hypothetical protein
MALTATPRADGALLSYAGTFSSGLSAQPTDYGMTVAQAASLATAYTAFSTALETAKNPATRTQVTVAQKQQASVDLRAILISYGAMILANRAVSDPMKIALGLRPRSKGQPIPPPPWVPGLDVSEVTNDSFTLKILGPNGKATRPPGVALVSTATWVGETFNPDLTKWTYQGQRGTMRSTITITGLTPGTVVWITAAYLNAKGETGPAAPPRAVTMQYLTAPVNAG